MARPAHPPPDPVPLQPPTLVPLTQWPTWTGRPSPRLTHLPATGCRDRWLPPSQQWGCLPSLLVPHPLLPRLIQPWPWRLFGPLPSGGTAIDAGPAKPQEAALFCPPLDKAPPSLLREGRPALPALLGALIPRLVPMTALPEGSSPLWAGQHSPTGELSIHLPLPLEPPPSTSWAPGGVESKEGALSWRGPTSSPRR